MTILCEDSGGLNLSLHLEPSFIDFLVDQRIKQQNALDLSTTQNCGSHFKEPGSEEFLVVNKFMNKCFGSLSVKINTVPKGLDGGIFHKDVSGNEMTAESFSSCQNSTPVKPESHATLPGVESIVSRLNQSNANLNVTAYQQAERSSANDSGYITQDNVTFRPVQSTPFSQCSSQPQTIHPSSFRFRDTFKRKRGRAKRSGCGLQFGAGTTRFGFQTSSGGRPIPNKTFQCPLCDFCTPYYSSLDVHTKSIHSMERPFSCVLCEYTCKLKGNLKKHYMGIHKLESEPATSLLKHSSADKSTSGSEFVVQSVQSSAESSAELRRTPSEVASLGTVDNSGFRQISENAVVQGFKGAGNPYVDNDASDILQSVSTSSDTVERIALVDLASPTQPPENFTTSSVAATNMLRIAQNENFSRLEPHQFEVTALHNEADTSSADDDESYITINDS